MLYRRSTVLLVAGALFSVAGCGGSTTRHLVSIGDEVRISVGTLEAQPNWAALSFTDSAWAARATAFLQSLDGATMPAEVTVRRTFDIGADFTLFRTLSLSFDPGAPYDVFLNGEQVANGDGKSSVSFSPPAGLLRASGNVLGLLVHAGGNAEMRIGPTLDGDAIDAAQAGVGAMVVRGPWLIAPTADGVTIVWETNQPVASSAVVDGKAFDGGAGTRHIAKVSGLQPSHAYPYHLDTNGVSTEEAELTTAPADKSARIRFIAYGDNRTDGDAHRRVVDAMRNEGADFVVNTGDLVASSNDSEWQTFFDIEYAFLARTPFVPTIGNHEDMSGGSSRFSELFPLGSDRFKGHVYGFDYGSVHIAVLDSNQFLRDQAPWLDADLAAAEANGARHLFVVMHWGPYSSGKTLNHGCNDDAQLYIEPIARAHRVDAFVAGHDHFYERGNANGLRYFVVGGGGAPLVDPGSIQETDVTRKLHHYVVFDVVGDVAHAVAKDDSGTQFDTVDLSRLW
jgi:predicted phosphodiesterase